MIYSRPKSFYCGDRALQSPFDRQLSDPHAHFGTRGEEKNILSLPKRPANSLLYRLRYPGLNRRRVRC